MNFRKKMKLVKKDKTIKSFNLLSLSVKSSIDRKFFTEALTFIKQKYGLRISQKHLLFLLNGEDIICPFCNSKIKSINASKLKKTCGSNICIKSSKEKTCTEKYGVCNYTKSEEYKVRWENEIEPKRKITWNKILGVDNPMKSEKIKTNIEENCIKKYGVTHFNKSKEFKKSILERNTKRKSNNIIKYGAEEYFQSEIGRATLPERQKKIEQRNLEKFGVTNYTHTQEYKDRISDIKNKTEKTCKRKWNNKTYSGSKHHKQRLPEIQSKRYKTLKKNQTFNTSKPENNLYIFLKILYPDVIAQYYSKEYPFNCDFYIPSLNLYIEYQGTWTHGKEPFNRRKKDHRLKLKKWEEKAKTKKYYKTAIKVWTKTDVEKRKIIKKNKLNYLEFFTYKEIITYFSNHKKYKRALKTVEFYKLLTNYFPQIIFDKEKTTFYIPINDQYIRYGKKKINKQNVLYFSSIYNLKKYLKTLFNNDYYNNLNISYSDSDLKSEYINIHKKIISYNDIPRNNKLLLSCQYYNFYKREIKIWENNDERAFLVQNRIKYINKGWGTLNSKEIFRGFKISGKINGYSHFCYSWIIKFIRDYKITSMYDPCAGWGHRLIGSGNIEYHGNDINNSLLKGYEQIKLIINKNNCYFYNEDAGNFYPKGVKVDSIFTSPPYYNKEIYTEYGAENFKTKKLFFNWWIKVLKNCLKLKPRIFGIVICNEYKKEFIKCGTKVGLILNKEIKLGKSFNHFNYKLKQISKKQELLLIFTKK